MVEGKAKPKYERGSIIKVNTGVYGEITKVLARITWLKSDTTDATIQYHIGPHNFWVDEADIEEVVRP